MKKFNMGVGAGGAKDPQRKMPAKPVMPTKKKKS
jgi:hypothetical protein